MTVSFNFCIYMSLHVFTTQTAWWAMLKCWIMMNHVESKSLAQNMGPMSSSNHLNSSIIEDSPVPKHCDSPVPSLFCTGGSNFFFLLFWPSCSIGGNYGKFSEVRTACGMSNFLPCKGLALSSHCYLCMPIFFRRHLIWLLPRGSEELDSLRESKPS